MITAQISPGKRTIKAKTEKGIFGLDFIIEPEKTIDGWILEYIENGKEKREFVEDRRKAVNYLLQKGFHANQAEIAKFITMRTYTLVLFK